MSLSATLQSGVLAAFKALGDLNKSTTYKSVTGVTRDIAAGTSVPVSTNTDMNYGVFVRLAETEKDQGAPLTDSKFLFPRQLLNVEPKASDIVVDRVSGQTWEIVKRMSPPGSAVTILMVRTSK